MLKTIYHPFKRPGCLAGSKGSVLIGAIVAVVIMAALGAGMVGLLSTSAFHEVRANYGERAYYLAESGFRYAVSMYESDFDEDALEDLDGTKINVPAGGEIEMEVSVDIANNPDEAAEPYPNPNEFIVKAGWKQRDGSGNPILFSEGESIPNGSNLQVELNEGEELPRYRGEINIDGFPTTIRYQRRTGSIVSNGKVLYTLNKISYDEAHDLLAPNPTDGVGAGLVYPVEFAEITSTGIMGSGALRASRSVNYIWPLSRPSTESSLPPGDLSDDPLFDPADFPEGQKPEYLTTPISGPHWSTDRDSEVTQETYVHPQGGSYERLDLKVINYKVLQAGGETIRYNWVPFNHQPAALAMGQAWKLNHNMLSYDVQIKISTGPSLRYASLGFMFRAQRQGTGQNRYYSGYGISFMRYRSDGTADYVPSSVKPYDTSARDLNGRLLVVLWQQTAEDQWQWLAYKKLHRLIPGSYNDTWASRTFSERFDTYVRGSQYDGDGYFIHDDTTLMVRVVERVADERHVNDIQLFIGDARWTSNSQTRNDKYEYPERRQDTNAYNVGRSGYGYIYEATGRFGYEQRFAPPGAELWAWPSVPNITSTYWDPASNDWFTAVAWDGINPNAANAQLLTSHGVASVVRDSTFTTENYHQQDWNNQETYPHFVLHTFGHTSSSYDVLDRGPIHFRDFAVRLMKSPTGESGGVFINPIQY